MTLTFTVLFAGRRISRQFSPTEAIAAALELRDRKHMLREQGFTVLLQGDDNVVHLIAHHQPQTMES